LFMNETLELNILKRIREGEVRAYEELVDHYKDFIFSLVLRIVGNREEAEEVAQDVFLKAFNSLAQFRSESKFSTWLYRIAYTTAVSTTRKKYDYSKQVKSDLTGIKSLL